MQSYADWAWNNTAARDPKTNLFYFNDAGAARVRYRAGGPTPATRER